MHRDRIVVCLPVRQQLTNLRQVSLQELLLKLSQHSVLLGA